MGVPPNPALSIGEPTIKSFAHRLHCEADYPLALAQRTQF